MGDANDNFAGGRHESPTHWVRGVAAGVAGGLWGSRDEIPLIVAGNGEGGGGVGVYRP